MRSSSDRSSGVREAVGVICLVVLIAAWALVTLFPAGGLGSLQATALRAAAAAAACVVVALFLSWPLKALGLVAWSPLRDGYRRRRELRERRHEQMELERGERRQAPYRAIEALPPAAEQG